MSGSSSTIPVAVAHGKDSEWFPTMISITYNNGKVLIIRPDHLVNAYWEPKGTQVSDDGKLEAIAMQFKVNFWVDADFINEEANEILDVLEPGMLDIVEMVDHAKKQRAEGEGKG